MKKILALTIALVALGAPLSASANGDDSWFDPESGIKYTCVEGKDGLVDIQMKCLGPVSTQEQPKFVSP